MKKLLLTAIGSTCFLAMAANVATTEQSPRVSMTSPAPATRVVKAPANTLEFAYHISTYYEEGPSNNWGNYFLKVTTSPDAREDAKYNIIDCKDGYVLQLDLYGYPGSTLPEGRYYPGDTEVEKTVFMYDPEWSNLQYYDKLGALAGNIGVTGPVEITRNDDGIYVITAEVEQNGQTVALRFEGRVNVTNTNEKPSAFPQFKRDVDMKMTGAIAFYQGTSDISGQGATYLNLYSGTFDPETGAMTEDGYTIAMLIGHKKILRKENYTLIPGTYEVSYSLKRDTWYPGREVDYMGVTMPFGTYFRQLSTKSGSRDYEYAFLQTGTLTIEETEDKDFLVVFDGVSTLGNTFKLTYKGNPIMSWTQSQQGSSISNLQDDVKLDFSKITEAHVWHTGMMGGCRTFIVDLGSPAGRDEAINYGGDLFRMELFLDEHCSNIQPGTYTVVERRWNSYELAAGGTYPPFTCNKGRFVDGYLSGTRYAHFEEGRYCVEDLGAPADEGRIGITKEDNGDYTFDIDIIDDAGWMITGKWTGPLDLRFNPEELAASIDGISSDKSTVSAVVDGTTLVITGAEGVVTLYNLAGAKVAAGSASDGIDIAGLTSGVYLLRAGSETIKIVL